jgi:hypothetical protein
MGLIGLMGHNSYIIQKHEIQENDYLGEKSKEWNGRQAVLSDLSNFKSPDFCFVC